MKAPAFLRGLITEIRQQELRRLIRSVAVIEALLIAVVAAYCALAPDEVSDTRVVFVSMALFAAVCTLFRLRPLFPHQTRLKLAAETWLMTAFITVVLGFSGGTSSALLGLYLLPTTLSALALGRIMTLIQVAAVCALYALLAMASPDFQGWSLGALAGALARLVPFLLVAYLTSTLAADIFAARRRIESLAQTDSLTGLLNLRTFNERFRQAHAASTAESRNYSVIMLDMDNLKNINDEFGHDAGNSAIVVVANCIRRTVRASDLAARFGGDEFVLMLPGVETQVAASIAQKLRNLVFNTTLDVGSRIIRCTVSVGTASFPQDGRDAHELLTLADRRMYRDKELRRPVARAPAEAQIRLN
jgi:diguanylate cyclase (GGDEF)-like protein